MSAPKKKSKRSKSRKTKAEILAELKSTQRALIEAKEELLLCKEERNHVTQNQPAEARTPRNLVKPAPADAQETKSRQKTVPITIASQTRLIQEHEPFAIAIHIDMTKITEQHTAGLLCKTRLYAKRISDGWSGQIGESSTRYEGIDAVTMSIQDLVLEAGLYRLQATASFTSNNGAPLPIAALHEGQLIQVV